MFSFFTSQSDIDGLPPLSSEDEKIKVDIIEYILNHKNEVNYTEKIFNKLEIILNDLLGGQ